MVLIQNAEVSRLQFAECPAVEKRSVPLYVPQIIQLHMVTVVYPNTQNLGVVCHAAVKKTVTEYATTTEHQLLVQKTAVDILGLQQERVAADLKTADRKTVAAIPVQSRQITELKRDAVESRTVMMLSVITAIPQK